MSFLRRHFIRPFKESPEGKPRLLKKLLTGSRVRFTHRLITQYLEPADVVLDVGARHFPYTKYQDVASIYGVDLPSDTEGYLGWTEGSIARVSKLGNISAVYGDCTALPFVENSFDKVILMEVLEHIPNDALALSEISRCLRPGGALLLSVPNLNDIPRIHPHHVRHYTPDGLETILKANFDQVKLFTKFPNRPLYAKTVATNQPTVVRISRSIAYDLWAWLYGNRHYPGGSSIFAICRKGGRDQATSHPMNSPPTTHLRGDRSILACPVCKSGLSSTTTSGDQEGTPLTCTGCGAAYTTRDGIPLLLPKESADSD